MRPGPWNRAGLSESDVDLVEINEALATMSVACARKLGFPHDIVNVNGGAVGIGHPVGASGARILVTLIHELRRRGGGIGVGTLCAGGGMGSATVLEVHAPRLIGFALAGVRLPAPLVSASVVAQLDQVAVGIEQVDGGSVATGACLLTGSLHVAHVVDPSRRRDGGRLDPGESGVEFLQVRGRRPDDGRPRCPTAPSCSVVSGLTRMTENGGRPHLRGRSP